MIYFDALIYLHKKQFKAYEGEVEKIDFLLDTKNSIDDIFRQAQTAYNKWAKFEPTERTTAKLLGIVEFMDGTVGQVSPGHIKFLDTEDFAGDCNE